MEAYYLPSEITLTRICKSQKYRPRMYQTNSKINVITIALNAVFVSTLLLFSTNKGLSEPKTWENLVERKNLFFEKFKNTPFNGKIETYWPNGHLKETGKIKNGKKHNLWEYYYKNGKMKETEFFNLGTLNGTSEQYGSGGQLYIKAIYKNGKLDGPWIYIDPLDGWIYIKGQYKAGRKTGTWTFFTMLGDIERKEIWKDGQKIFDSTESEDS